MSPDRHQSMQHLLENHAEGVEFAIHVARRASRYAIVAPHGGGIEPGTSEIAEEVAGDEHSLYIFDGYAGGRSRALHITSTRFDESRCLDLVGRAEAVLTIHGKSGAMPVVYIGGLDSPLIGRLAGEFHAAAIPACLALEGEMAGSAVTNICNRGRSGRGCQLEISAGLRRLMFASLEREGRKTRTSIFSAFIRAVRAALVEPAAG